MYVSLGLKTVLHVDKMRGTQSGSSLNLLSPPCLALAAMSITIVRFQDLHEAAQNILHQLRTVLGTPKIFFILTSESKFLR